MDNLYFVRHGQSEANATKTLAGWQDSPLTDKGLEQAERLGDNLASGEKKFDYIITSPLQRAYKTAEILAAHLHFPSEKIIIDDAVKERGGGKLEGRLRRETYDYSEAEAVVLGAEPFEDFVARVSTFWQKVQQLEGSVLLVSHSGFGKMLDLQIKGRPPRALFEHPGFPNATLIEFSAERTSISTKP